MIRKALSLIAAGLMFAVAPSAFAQTVTGEVTDANDTVVFKGARVTITELSRSATTDDRGLFRFTNVPEGEYTLVVSYVGAADKSVPIGESCRILGLAWMCTRSSKRNTPSKLGR